MDSPQSENSEVELEGDFQAAEDYRDRYTKLKSWIESKLITSPIIPFEAKNEIGDRRKFKLPNIESKNLVGTRKNI